MSNKGNKMKTIRTKKLIHEERYTKIFFNDRLKIDQFPPNYRKPQIKKKKRQNSFKHKIKTFPSNADKKTTCTHL